MELGALSGFLVVLYTGNLWLGLLVAGISGSLMNLILGFLVVSLKLNQFVSGLGITFFARGLSYLLYRVVVGTPGVPPTIQSFPAVKIPFLSEIPFIGTILFSQPILVYIAFVVVGLITFVLYETLWGLKLRTVGENPAAADVMGNNVSKIRYLSLICGGFIIGIGGAYFSLVHINMFIQGLINGRGFICMALVVFGSWRPIPCLIGALIFGIIEAFQFRLQIISNIPYQFFQILPYLATIIILIFVSRKAIAPAAIMEPYRREE
jgi:simple sugar transport system permease protein